MRSFVPVLVACAGLLAGYASVARPAIPAQGDAAFEDRAADERSARWRADGIRAISHAVRPLPNGRPTTRVRVADDHRSSAMGR